MNYFSNYYHRDLNLFIKKLSPKSQCLILANTLAYKDDIQAYLHHLRSKCTPKTRVVVIYFNFFWKPILTLATWLNLRRLELKEPNWLSSQDIRNLFNIEGFDEIKRVKRLLFPLDLGFISTFINHYLGQLPIINNLCLTTYQIFRLRPKPQPYSVSIIIPARNEEGNIKGILRKIPKMGTSTEVIFVEGHSKDNTYQAIQAEIKANTKRLIKARVFKQKGIGKADAVRLGFSRAKNEILMILDADLAVPPTDLPKFYCALSEGFGELANGSRLVYPVKHQAMRTLNYLGNKIFSWIFSFLLDQPIKDTLCGTKALFRQDYLTLSKNQSYLGNFDPFGDFNLLFGAARNNLKIIEIPVRYRERKYGRTNISRFLHGWLLLKMTMIAAKKIKFI